MLSLEQVSDHQSEVWILRYALYTDPHNKKIWLLHKIELIWH